MFWSSGPTAWWDSLRGECQVSRITGWWRRRRMMSRNLQCATRSCTSQEWRSAGERPHVKSDESLTAATHLGELVHSSQQQKEEECVWREGCSDSRWSAKCFILCLMDLLMISLIGWPAVDSESGPECSLSFVLLPSFKLITGDN